MKPATTNNPVLTKSPSILTSTLVVSTSEETSLNIRNNYNDQSNTKTSPVARQQDSLARDANPFKLLLDTYDHYENFYMENSANLNPKVTIQDTEANESITEEDFDVYFENAINEKKTLKKIDEEQSTSGFLNNDSPINSSIKQCLKSSTRRNNKLVKLLNSLTSPSALSSNSTSSTSSERSPKDDSLNESVMSTALLPPLPRNSIPHSVSLGLSRNAEISSNFDFERNSSNRRSVRFGKQNTVIASLNAGQDAQLSNSSSSIDKNLSFSSSSASCSPSPPNSNLALSNSFNIDTQTTSNNEKETNASVNNSLVITKAVSTPSIVEQLASIRSHDNKKKGSKARPRLSLSNDQKGGDLDIELNDLSEEDDDDVFEDATDEQVTKKIDTNLLETANTTYDDFEDDENDKLMSFTELQSQLAAHKVNMLMKSTVSLNHEARSELNGDNRKSTICLQGGNFRDFFIFLVNLWQFWLKVEK